MINWNKVNGAMTLETTFPCTGNMPDPGFDLFFGALGVTAVVGHVKNAAGLEFGKHGRIFFDHDEHGAGFAMPYLELIEGMRFVHGKLDAVKPCGFQRVVKLTDGAGVHFDGCHGNTSEKQ